MDGESLKTVIAELNKILHKNLTLISFDLLSPEQILQILSDVICYIEGIDLVDIRQEELETTVVRILEMLRILKYRLNENVSPVQFRQGLVQGDKKIIHPILEWLTANVEDLKKRAYLARFLVKLEIPQELLADSDIAFLYEQYETQIEEFKNVHKESEALKDAVFSVSELRSDISAMEVEKESVVKKTDRLKRRIENVPERQKFLESAKNLRLEKERKRELVGQEEKQQSQLAANEQRLRRMVVQLQELRQNADRTIPQDLLRQIEEECSVNTYLAQQKLPAELRARQEEIDMMENIINQPSLSRAHLDDINFKIQQVNNEISQLMESQLAGQSSGEDKNAPFRQQAAIIARKKEGKAEQLSELRSQLSLVEEELAGKQKQLHEIAGDTVLRGEEFKKYVTKLRGKSALYKKQKAQLAALKSEAGVLTRTLEILASRDQSVIHALAREEEKHGVEGFRETRNTLESVSELKSEVDLAKGNTLQNMSKLVVELSKRIAEKKFKLEPLIGELRPLRQEHSELYDQYEQMKKVYDSNAAALENANRRLQQEVDKMQAEMKTTEDEIDRLQNEIAKAQKDAVRAAEEVKLYLMGAAEAKKQSLREEFQLKIAEQEKISKLLKEEQNSIKELQGKSAVQLKMWEDLERLLKCKLQCLEEEAKGTGFIRREKGAETLILPQ